jgi:predicted O-linked N-acetylglucosamine transferase (SPINDLY family)
VPPPLPGALPSTAPQILLARAIQLQRAGRHADAVPLLRQCERAEPTPQGSYSLGISLQALGAWNDAAAAYARAAEQQPHYPDANNNAGVCLHQAGDFQGARRHLELAAQQAPSLYAAHYNLGRTRLALGQTAEAVDALQRAYELDPGLSPWLLLHTALIQTRQLDRATRLLADLDARTAAPPADLLSAGLTFARRISPAFEARYTAAVSAWLNAPPVPAQKSESAIASELISAAQYFDFAPDDLYALYRRLDDATQPLQRSAVPSPPRRTRGDRLRLGYLSPDFRKHVMGTLWLPILAAHDRAQYEINLLSTCEQAQEDDVTRALCDHADRFVRLAQLDDDAAARQIASLDLDVLVDLAAHTEGSRPLILARRPARLQITHLGYHGCVGLRAVDYKLTDRYCDNPETVRFQIEAPLYLDQCVFPLRRVHAETLPTDARDRAGLTDKCVFGVFVNVLKLSPRLLACWKRILERVPESVLAFSPNQEDDRLAIRAITREAGITPDRVHYIPRQPSEALQRARYQLVDVVLDTFPYSGGDTTLAAIDAHTPVVTLAGFRHAERTSASILHHLGLGEMIARNEAEYVEHAVVLATHPERRAALAARVRDALSNHPIADPTAYARALDRAYRHALESKNIALQPTAELDAETLYRQIQRAAAAHQANDFITAERLYRQVLQDQPSYAPVTYLLGMLEKARGEPDSARETLLSGLNHAPHHADTHAALASLAFDQKDYATASKHFQAVLDADPTRTDARVGLGLAALKLHEPRAAREALVRAAVEQPADANVLYNLGVAEQALGNFDAARAAYRNATTLDPNHKEALFNYGVLLREQGQPELAIKCWQRVLHLDPRFEDAYLQLRPTLLATGHIPTWLDNLDRYDQNIPGSPRAHLYSIEACFYLGRADEARRHLDQAIAAALNEAHAEIALELLEELLYVVLFFDVPEADHYRLYQRYDTLIRARHPAFADPAPRPPDRPIRLAYLTADARQHVMGQMLLGILRHHDAARFSITVYSLSLVEDAITEQIARHCRFERIAGMSPLSAAERIRADDIDILIDCCTHTKGSEPGILAHRPARCQITHVASSGAFGSTAIDYKLTDPCLDLAESQRYLLETLLPIEGACLFPYRQIQPARPTPYRRSALALPKEAVLFGAFVQILKLSPRLLRVWKRLLDRLPRAMIAFSPGNTSSRQGYINLCGAHGIAAERITFLDAGTTDAINLARYDVVDAVLDTFPYGGVNGTLEAVAAGKPVVALVGKRNQERTSHTILTHLGITETLAQSEQQYVEIACRLALDAGYRADVSERMRAALPGSRLADTRAHVLALEAAYLRGLNALERQRQRA